MIKPLFSESCSIVVPVYKAEDTIIDLIEQFARTLPTLFPRFEVICVVDGSPDHSWELIKGLKRKYNWLRGIRLIRNFGQQNATFCGVQSAKFELTATLDDDLQHPPEELYLLVQKMHEGFDVVYGTPKRMPAGIFRNLATYVTKRALVIATQHRLHKDESSFRLFRTNLKNAFRDFRSSDVVLDVLLAWGTSKFSSVKVNIRERKIGKSNYNFTQLIRTALMILTGFSTIPLRIASLVGFIMTILGLVILIYVMVIYFTQGSVPGFTFLSSLIAIFSGAQLFSLGMLGEYMARIFNRSMDRPVYVVEETFGETIQRK